MNENTGNSEMILNEEQGTILLKLARQTIAEKLGIPLSPQESVRKADLSQNIFSEIRGVFVTLKISGQLRGCIGSLSATESILEGVRRNALNAAFHDPRFSPLSKDEMKSILMEVSILTTPQRLPHMGGADLLEKLQPHTDGVIIRKGYHSATFLPQVWEQLPVPENFLTHLCLKAGLPPDAWHDENLEVQVYHVQYFEEKE